YLMALLFVVSVVVVVTFFSGVVVVVVVVVFCSEVPAGAWANAAVAKATLINKRFLTLTDVSGSHICAGPLLAGLLHGTVIEDLAFARLSKTFCLPVKIKEWAGKGLDRAYLADLGTVERTADGLFKCRASLVIEKRHCYMIKSLADKI